MTQLQKMTTAMLAKALGIEACEECGAPPYRSIAAHTLKCSKRDPSKDHQPPRQ